MSSLSETEKNNALVAQITLVKAALIRKYGSQIVLKWAERNRSSKASQQEMESEIAKLQEASHVQ